MENSSDKAVVQVGGTRMIKLSQIARHPAVKAAFARIERDNGAPLTVPAPKAPVLTGGAARVLEDA